MPESRGRRKDVYTPPPTRSPAKMHSGRWVAPTFVTLFLIGLVWIVTYYVAGSSVPGMSTLAGWNIVVGFGFIIAGFVVSTRWR